jgi:hypothetical protein
MPVIRPWQADAERQCLRPRPVRGAFKEEFHAFREDHDSSDRAFDGAWQRGVRAIRTGRKLERDVRFEFKLHVVVQLDVVLEFHDGLECDDLDQAEDAQENPCEHLEQFFVEQFDELVVVERHERLERPLIF